MTNDEYEQALKDASVALDALADRAFAVVKSLNINSTGEDAYDYEAHRGAVMRHSGICSAVLEVYGLLNAHRKTVTA